MSQVDNVDNIKFSTGFASDKVFAEKFTGSFSVTASSSTGTGRVTTESLTNDYGADVLPFMLYSTNNSDWYDGGQSIQTSQNIRLAATAYTTSSAIVIVVNNFTTSSYTLYYKLGLISDD